MELYKENHLKVYNSLSKSKEDFKPITEGYVGMYVCGPTVYSNAHLRNVRTFMVFDVVYRYLLHLGYKVRYVRNITDAGHLENDAEEGEDKIAKKARLEQIEPMEVVQRYTVDFHNVLKNYNFLPPSIEPTATGHIVEQIEMIKEIIEKGFGYEVNGSVYFDVHEYNKKENYGILSGRKVEDLIHNTRTLDGQSDKKNPQDFALWKKADERHIMRWPSPWSDGFPGWHLECSVMSTKYLGESFDIHGGGMDLKFPHHECEIAQSKTCSGVKPVNYWMHTNMLSLNGQRMAKSTGNYILPNQILSGENNILPKPSVKVGFNYQYITFKNQVPTIYFSPEKFNAGEVFLNLIKDEATAKPKAWFYNLTAAFGYQFIEDDAKQSTYRIQGAFGYRFSERSLLNVYGTRSNIASATASGFTFTEIGLRFKWQFLTKSVFRK